MSWPAPSELLRHVEPALLLAAIEDHRPGSLRCTSTRRATWGWPEMLEAGAQAAGLLAGLHARTPIGASVLIAEYRDVRVHAARHVGVLTIDARLDRKLLQFQRCRVEVCAEDGRPLLDGLVALAPGADGR